MAWGYGEIAPVYGVGGAWLVLTLLAYPYVLLPVAAALRGVDASLEEAARSLGDSGGHAFVRAVLPQVRPALATGAVLASLFVVSDLGAVALLEVQTLTVSIYDTYQGGGDPSRSAVLACALVLSTLVLVGAEARWRGRARQYRLGSGCRRPVSPIALGRWRWPALLFPLVVLTLAIGVPGGVLGAQSFTALSADPVDRAALLPAATASVGLATIAAALTVTAALPVALMAAWRSDRVSRVVERAAYMIHCLPGLVAALAVAYFAQRLIPAGYPRLPALIFTYMVLFLPLAVSPLYGRARLVPPILGSVARSLGRRPGAVLGTVTAPLLAPGAAAGAALVFLACLKELPAALVIAPLGFQTLAIQAFTAAEDGAAAGVVVPSLLLAVIGLVTGGPLLRRLGEAELG